MRNYYPVAQKLTISIGGRSRRDAEPHCASGTYVERIDEPPWKQFWFDELHNDIVEDRRSTSFSPQRWDHHYVELEWVVDNDV